MEAILSHFRNILKVYSGEEAWKKVIQLRYSPGTGRAHIRRLYAADPKDTSLLVLFHDKKKKTIEYRFYLQTENVTNINNEGDVNMFGKFSIDILDDETGPIWEKRNFKFLRNLLR